MIGFRLGILRILCLVCPVAGTLCILIGSSIWTVLVGKLQVINNDLLKSASADIHGNLGIIVSEGPGLYLSWVAFIFMFLAISPGLNV